MQQWFQSNLDVVFYVYGLTLLSMGLIILVHPKKDSQYALAKILWLFVAYALIHFPSDSIHMLTVTKDLSPLILHTADIMTYISYFFLLEFGRRLLNLIRIPFRWWIPPISFIIVALISLPSNEPWTTFDVLLGYFIRFPAGLMAGFGFIMYYRLNLTVLEDYRVKIYFDITGYALICWALFCGLVRSQGTFFPANMLNTESFFQTFNIPVHLFRSICAIMVAVGVPGILRIFNLEGRKRILDSQRGEREAILRHKNEIARVQTRDRVTQNLHDEVGSTLLGIVLFAEAIQNEKDTDKGSQFLQRIIQNTSEAQEKMRDLLWIIDPANDSWDALLAKMRRYASDKLEGVNTEHEIDLPSSISLPILDMERRQHFWLIYKELINNIAKHAGAEAARVELTIEEKTVQLKVEDQGTGFDTGIAAKSSGLKDILSRIEKIGGRYELSSAEGAGTQWTVELNP